MRHSELLTNGSCLRGDCDCNERSYSTVGRIGNVWLCPPKVRATCHVATCQLSRKFMSMKAGSDLRPVSQPITSATEADPRHQDFHSLTDSTYLLSAPSGRRDVSLHDVGLKSTHKSIWQKKGVVVMTLARPDATSMCLPHEGLRHVDAPPRLGELSD